MTYHKADQTLMYQEAEEASTRVAHQVTANKEMLSKLAQQLRRKPPSFVVTCARGSSDHAATHVRYLIETSLGLPTGSAAPSVSSVFGAEQKMAGVLFIALSQSGRSPDILTTTKMAKAGGALVVCAVNDENSPLAKISDFTIPLHAGPEKSVAATKSFICTLSAMTNFVAAWQENKDELQQLDQLPDLLSTAFAQDWTRHVDILKPHNNLFVVSRGLGLGVVQEAALKFKETCGLHAEAISAAEIQHGPMSLVHQGFPVFIYSLNDKTQSSIDDVAISFANRKATILSAGATYDTAYNLETVSCDSPQLRPILFIQSFYKFVNALSLARGFNPDQPPFLKKITETI